MIENIILLFTIVYASIIYIINMLLNNNNWYFRNWIVILSFFIIHIGTIGFITLKIRKIKLRNKREVILVIWIIISIFIILTNVTMLGLMIKSSNIKEIEGKKYIGIEYLSNRLTKTIYYYDTYNIFAYKINDDYIEEFYNYDNYDMPVFRKYYQNNYVKNILYFYDNENIRNE